MRARNQQEEEHDDQSSVLYQLCSMIYHILESPPPSIPVLCSSSSSSSSTSATPRRLNVTTASQQISPTAFAYLFLGISLALMLFGSVTFVIGFILMPCIVGMILVFYAAGIVSNLSELGHAIFCSSSPSSNDKPPDVNSNGDEEDGDKTKENDGVY
ncbi:hypothetical protein RJ641_007133 [Dillenia turbinata]|uniref:Transmembrane protein n=1 Tax=Dillenia turbinata TaxID=194707 RepID=A0AAN8VJK6_9MAGN